MAEDFDIERGMDIENGKVSTTDLMCNEGCCIILFIISLALLAAAFSS